MATFVVTQQAGRHMAAPGTRHFRKGLLVVALVALAVVAAACSSSAGSGLTGKTWQLTAITEKTPAFQGVVPADQQANYTIEFKADGTFSAKADCNNLSGTFTTADPTTASGDLTLVLGPATLAACADGSYSDLYIVALSNTASYAIANSQLTITLKDQGTLTFK
jgi:heat shock protein HslJ